MRILFVHQGLMSFVKKDLEILRSAHEVHEIHYRGIKEIPAILRGTLWADLTFSWFGKLHAFFAVLFSRLLKKKSVVVAGGDDVACERDIGYGMLAYWWKKWCPLFLFHYADLALSVSKSNYRETIFNAKADPCKTKLVYHGFETDGWFQSTGRKKEHLVLTVGRVSEETVVKKGLELFVKSAQFLPNVPFVLVGPWKDRAIDKLKRIAPPNVTFTGGLYGENLIGILRRAKVYVQASFHESFGCSLAEAMLCECIPVVTRRAALPEVVGVCGFYVDTMEPQVIAATISKAFEAPEEFGRNAADRIASFFPLEKRRKEILQAIEFLHP